MKINGSLVFDASSASEIQNLRLQKVTALPAIGSGDVGRLIYNTNTNIIHVGTNVGNTLSWVPLATGGDASALLGEVDRIETALGLNSDGSFNADAFTGNLAGQTDLVGVISTLQGLAAAAQAAAAAEATAARSAELILRNDLASEVTARGAAVTAEADARTAAITAEATRATGVEGGLRTDLDAEVTRATGAEGALGTRVDGIVSAATANTTRIEGLITAEASRATGEEGRIEDLVTAEATARANGDTANADALQDEIDRATGVEDTLGDRITTEVSDRTDAVDDVASNLADEVSRAQGIEAGLRTDLDAEIADRATAISDLRTEVTSSLAGLTWEAPVAAMGPDHTAVTNPTVGERVLNTTDNTIYTWSGTAWTGEALVDGAAFFNSSNDTGYVFNGTAVVPFSGAASFVAGNGLVMNGNRVDVVSAGGSITVTEDSIEVSQAIRDSIDANAAAVVTERGRAQTAEAGLGDRITDETTARTNALTAEATARANAITAEAGARAAADTALGGRIDSLTTTVTNNATAATDAVAGEVARATAEEARIAGLVGDEVTARGAAITQAISTEVAARNAAIAAEATARDAAIAAEAAARTAAATAEAARVDAAAAADRAIVRKMYFLYDGAPSATHTVTHNLGQRYCNVTVVDQDHNVVIPESIVFTGDNALTVTFNTAIACRVVVMGLAAAA